MEFGYENIPGFKLGLHILQILFGFIAWILGIVVFRGDGAIVNGQNGWAFAVPFLSIPAWIYLIGAPRYPRTRKLAEPHAMIAVDVIYTILWLSAFAAQASYNTANLCGSVCSPSKGIVALGFFVTLFFIGTSTLSIFTLRYYQFNHRLPGYDSFPAQSQNIDPDKAAFSMAPVDEEYAPVHRNDHDDHNDHNDHNDGGYGYSDSDYAAAGQDPYRPGHAGRPAENPFDDSSEYQPQIVPGRYYAPPSAQDEHEESGPAQFPAANYDRVVR